MIPPLLTAARVRVVEAAKVWYEGKGNVEAPLAVAVTDLHRLERVTPSVLATPVETANPLRGEP